MEDRRLLTTYWVDSPGDAVALDDVVTLREALTAANTNSAFYDCEAGSDVVTDHIYFATGSVTLTSGELAASDDVTIGGPPGSHVTVVASTGSRAFSVTCNASFFDLTITGCIVETFPVDVFRGGGICNYMGNLSVTNSEISDNEASGTGGQGGGVYHDGGDSICAMSIEDSAITNNDATAKGGGIYHDRGNLTISGTSTTLMVEEEETSLPYWIADEKECQWTADNVADFLDHYDGTNDAIDPADGVTILSGNRAGGNGGGNGSDPMLQRRQDVRVPGNERGEGLAAEGTGPSAKGGRYGPGTP